MEMTKRCTDGTTWDCFANEVRKQGDGPLVGVLNTPAGSQSLPRPRKRLKDTQHPRPVVVIKLPQRADSKPLNFRRQSVRLRGNFCLIRRDRDKYKRES